MTFLILNSKEAQRCYCETAKCRGFIGATDVSNEVDIEIEDDSKSLMKSKSDKETVDKLKEEFEDLAVSIKKSILFFILIFSIEQSSNLNPKNSIKFSFSLLLFICCHLT